MSETKPANSEAPRAMRFRKRYLAGFVSLVGTIGVLHGDLALVIDTRPTPRFCFAVPVAVPSPPLPSAPPLSSDGGVGGEL